MTGDMNRRNLILGGLAAGAALSLPARAFARALQDSTLTTDFDKAFGLEAVPQPVAPVEPALPMVAPPNPAYDARLVGIAKREMREASRHGVTTPEDLEQVLESVPALSGT